MPNDRLRVLFVGDVFADVGRRVLAENLRGVLDEHAVDLCIANGENCAGGRGITQPLAKKLHKYGAQIITGGNHSLTNQDGHIAHQTDPNLLRPHNLPPGNVGVGKLLYQLTDAISVGVVNLMGRTFSHDIYDCPFRTGLEAVQELAEHTPIVIVDFHAEATSEKIAFALYVDGQVSAVIGTHTHVQTADERILAKGTAFISDVGMTGPEDSVIGMRKEQIIRKFMLQTYERFEPSQSGPMLNAALIDIDPKSGKALEIRRILKRVTFQ
jgi:metallophosphoesterase (TIGR00282 family)